jgi:hypothetical protein
VKPLNGPWNITEREHQFIIDGAFPPPPGSRNVLKWLIARTEGKAPVDRANARQIAASPDLVTLLGRYLDNHCMSADAEGGSTLCECGLCKDTRAVLAVVDGQ